MTKEEFIEKARQVHGDKYDYSKVEFKGGDHKVIIVCPIHGDFSQTPNNHKKGQNCPHCQSKKWTQERFLNEARQVHGDYYDYSKSVYRGLNHRVTITCHCKDRDGKEHGDFPQTPKGHILLKHGCPECGKIRMGMKHRLTTEEFIERSRKIHNDKYDYSRVKYETWEVDVEIICPTHGVFPQRPTDHLAGSGCPFCKRSKLEERIGNLLSEHNFKFIPQHKFDELLTEKGVHQKLDFYLPDYNIAIECQGEQHYKPVDFAGKGEKWASEFHNTVKKLDERKLKICKEKGIEIIYFANEKYDDKVITDENLLVETIKKYGNI